MGEGCPEDVVIGLISETIVFTHNVTPSATDWAANFSALYGEVNGELDSANVKHGEADSIMTVDQASTKTTDLTMSAASIAFTGNITASAWGATGVYLSAAAATFTDSSTAASGTAALATFASFAQPTLAATNTSVTTTKASTVYIAGAPTAGSNQTITNAYALEVAAGAALFGGPIDVGIDDAGYDVRFYGATSGRYMLWDESADTLEVAGLTAPATDSTYDLGSASKRYQTVYADAIGDSGQVLPINGLDVTFPNTCFFHAQAATQSNVTGDGTTYTLTFGTEIADRGSDFSSPTFTAPVTGAYLLSIVLNFSGLTGSHTDTRVTLVTSNRSYNLMVDDVTSYAGISGAFIRKTFTVLADMDASDTATVTLQVSNGTKVVDIDTGSYFMGYLLG